MQHKQPFRRQGREREREKARERERVCHSSCSLLVLYCFQPEAYSCPVASRLSPVPGQGEGGLSVGTLSLQGDSHCHPPGVRVMADIQCLPDTKQPPNITSCLSPTPPSSFCQSQYNQIQLGVPGQMTAQRVDLTKGFDPPSIVLALPWDTASFPPSITPRAQITSPFVNYHPCPMPPHRPDAP